MIYIVNFNNNDNNSSYYFILFSYKVLSNVLRVLCVLLYVNLCIYIIILVILWVKYFRYVF